MVDAAVLTRQFIHSLESSQAGTWPYRHWLLADALTEAVADQIAALPMAPPTVLETYGKRETHNASRTYFNPEQGNRHPVCATVAAAMQSPEVTGTLESTCGIRLAGTYLRIEYCQDTDGFWLEPHTDIGVKKFTMLIYLSKDPGSEDWGTDILDSERNLVKVAPYRFNGGLIFIPANDTWHGFHKRPINGIRKSIIVNYVGAEWRARHELAFPDRPIA